MLCCVGRPVEELARRITVVTRSPAVVLSLLLSLKSDFFVNPEVIAPDWIDSRDSSSPPPVNQTALSYLAWCKLFPFFLLLNFLLFDFVSGPSQARHIYIWLPRYLASVHALKFACVFNCLTLFYKGLVSRVTLEIIYGENFRSFVFGLGRTGPSVLVQVRLYCTVQNSDPSKTRIKKYIFICLLWNPIKIKFIDSASPVN